MNIDFAQFTPASSFLGGLLIGLSALLLILCCGRIAGISGILGGLLTPVQPVSRQDIEWRVVFVGGILLSPVLYGLFFQLPIMRIDASWLVLVVAGVLVGAGTRLGSGCTSGHGICGLSRGSKRSFLATLIFMCVGVLSASINASISAYFFGGAV